MRQQQLARRGVLSLLQLPPLAALASVEQVQPVVVLAQGPQLLFAAASSSSTNSTSSSPDPHKRQQPAAAAANSTAKAPQPQRPRAARPPAPRGSSLLAAATERLQAAPDRPLNPLHALAASGIDYYKTHPLPAWQPDEEQARALAAATSVIERLRARGHSAYIVGGWVRDVYLGRAPADVDIATSATPSAVKALFQGDPATQLPRATVKLVHQGQVLELSCFKGISRTSSLFAVGLDAVTRDFTINALYFDPASGTVLDFVGGVPDARARILRLPSDASARLADDPLRVLRAVRLAAVLGLRLSPATAAALRQHAHLCAVAAGVPPRRIWLELRKLAAADSSQPGVWLRALKLAYHLGLLPHLFPWVQPAAAAAAATAATATAAAPRQQQQDLQQQQQQAGEAGGAGDGGSKAVMVAERLSRMQQQQRQQDSGDHGTWELSLPLLVAATVHPSPASYAAAEPHLHMLFPDPADLHDMQVLHTAAQLCASSNSSSIGSTSQDALPSSSSTSTSSSSSTGSSDEAWAAFFVQPQAHACLAILASWVPESLTAGFESHHRARAAQLAPLIQQHRQRQAAAAGGVTHAQHAQQPSQQQRVGPPPGGPLDPLAAVVGDGQQAGAAAGLPALQAAAAAAVSGMPKGPSDELAAAIHALVGRGGKQPSDGPVAAGDEEAVAAGADIA